jgi:hypothetical protein
LVYFMAVYGLFYGHVVYCMTIWYIFGQLGIFFRFGMLYQEQSGNQEHHPNHYVMVRVGYTVTTYI